MGKTEHILKLVAEALYEEEGTFFVTVHADELDMPLEGLQRLVIGGRATPSLEIKDDGMDASLSLNRVHYDIHIPWHSVAAIEGNGKAFFCRMDSYIADEGGEMDESKKPGKSRSHLKVVK